MIGLDGRWGSEPGHEVVKARGDQVGAWTRLNPEESLPGGKIIDIPAKTSSKVRCQP